MLLCFDGEFGFKPFVPSTLEGKDLLETHGDELSCHPGTGFLIGSGAVKDKSLVFGIFVRPVFKILLWILPHGTLNFPLTFLPLVGQTNIYNDHIRIA